MSTPWAGWRFVLTTKTSNMHFCTKNIARDCLILMLVVVVVVVVAEEEVEAEVVAVD
jgi:hypothetical protein